MSLPETPSRSARWAELDRTSVRFLLAGLLNTAFGYGLVLVMLLTPLPLWLQLLVATVISVAFNFLTSGRFVFRHAGWRPIGRFVGVYALMYVLNLRGVEALVGAGWRPFLAVLVLLPPSTVLTYLLQRFFVFAPRG